jgi:CubicO group peptidase (beta-lactamase class C family)
MNIRRIVGLVCFTWLILTFSLPAVAEDLSNALQAYVQQCVRAEIPNGCIVVGLLDEQGSQIISCGTLDNGTDQEANGDTLFCVRSMTGTFTRLLLQDMVERGEMKLDDPAAKYLPDSVRMATRNGKEITLRHLVDETSGIPDFWNTLNPQSADNPMADFTVEKMNAFVSGCQLAADPGTKHFHGGVDKGLLAQAIGLRAGTDFELLMIERFLRPLQMDNTRFTLTPEMKCRLASEHNELGYPMPRLEWGALRPLAGLYSTANDLLKFISALDLKPSSPLKGYWLVGFPPGAQRGPVVYTGGGGFGGRSLACYDRTRRRGAVILSTSADLTRNFDDYLLDCEWESDRRPTATNISTQLYDAYVGLYRPTRDQGGTNTYSSIGIRRQGDRLFAQAIGSSSWPAALLLPPIAGELLPQSPTRFFERLSGKPVAFSRDSRGKITGLTMTCQGKALSFDKVSDQPPKTPEPLKLQAAIKLDTALLDACAGQYDAAAVSVCTPESTLNLANYFRSDAHLSTLSVPRGRRVHLQF